ncbi:STAS domain-containing protein [Spirochaetota bacterium]
MNFTILQTSRNEEKIEHDSVILKVKAADVIDRDETNNLWKILKTLIDGGLNKIIIDMNNLDFIDSQGIGMLINSAKLLRTKKGDIGLIRVPENILNIFRPVNLQRFIQIFESEEEAIKFLKLNV